MAEHSHDFVYQGVQFADGNNDLPGSGAKRRYYAHAYFCKSCLEMRHTLIEHMEENSYQVVRFNAAPGDPKAIVPKTDQGRYW